MGKWATYQKRGTAHQQGFLTPPAAADWSFSGVTTTAFNVNLLVPIPPPATQWAIQTRQQGTTTWTLRGPTPATPINVTGLTTGTTYEVQAAYFLNGAQVSPWSPTKTQATA
jgi:hypothetical protein